MEGHTPIFPSKEQAVVLNATENLELMDYVKTIGNIVTPKNVLFASKISKERICIYLSATSWVDEVALFCLTSVRPFPILYLRTRLKH